MTTQTIFFATRTLARNALNESTAESAKFKDFGTNAPKGERWAILVEVQETTSTEQVNSTTRTELSESEIAMLNKRSGSIIGEQELITPTGKPVRVSWRRNMTGVRLAKHLQKPA